MHKNSEDAGGRQSISGICSAVWDRFHWTLFCEEWSHGKQWFLPILESPQRTYFSPFIDSVVNAQRGQCTPWVAELESHQLLTLDSYHRYKCKHSLLICHLRVSAEPRDSEHNPGEYRHQPLDQSMKFPGTHIVSRPHALLLKSTKWKKNLWIMKICEKAVV